MRLRKGYSVITAVMFTLGLAGCGTTAQQPDEPAPLAIDLQITADQSLNVSVNDVSNPVYLNIFLLSQQAQFNRATVDKLNQEPTESLGDSLIHKYNYFIRPGTTRHESLPLTDKTNYIAATGNFRSGSKDDQRTVLELRPVETDPLKVAVDLSGSALASENISEVERIAEETREPPLGRITVKGGFLLFSTSEDQEGTGATTDFMLAKNGFAVDLSVAFRLPLDIDIYPYIDYQWVSSDSQTGNNFGVGLQHGFNVVENKLDIILGYGVGYYLLDFDGRGDSNAIGGNIHTGLEWYFVRDWSLNFTLRADIANHDIQINSLGGATRYSQDLTLSSLVGLSWWY